MAPVTDQQVERVRALVADLPHGRVATYGDIAAVAGLSSARIVGWIMRTDSSDLPWHRVITASGRPARHLRTRQLELLRAEGVLATDGRIPLPEVQHRFGAQNTSRTTAAVRASPGNASAVDLGCSACTASRNINARNNICGHSGRAFQRSMSPSSASPQDNASMTNTPAAHDAGRQ